jgi:hypothetical protein
MTQLPVPDSLAATEKAVPGDTTAPERAGAPVSSADLPIERSKFSRWLASFGLGELPNPLLKPIKGRSQRESRHR